MIPSPKSFSKSKLKEAKRLKEELRQKILLQRKKMTLPEVEEKSQEICRKFISYPFFSRAETILFYYPLQKEVKIIPLLNYALQNKKRVLLPSLNEKKKKIEVFPVENLKEDLELGPFKIKQPIREGKRAFPKEKLDLVLVPGVAFDRQGNRLGYGKGYFDIFLQNLKAKKIGIAYDFQLVDSLPKEEHDVPLDIIITEKELVSGHKRKEEK